MAYNLGGEVPTGTCLFLSALIFVALAGRHLAEESKAGKYEPPSSTYYAKSFDKQRLMKALSADATTTSARPKVNIKRGGRPQNSSAVKAEKKIWGTGDKIQGAKQYPKGRNRPQQGAGAKWYATGLTGAFQITHVPAF